MKYQFVRLLPLVFAVWGVAPTFAGIFDSPLSDNDAKQIRKLAVVSTLGDGFRGQTEGLTVFQNKSFVANAAGWGLDKAIATQLSDSIVAYGKIVGEVAPLQSLHRRKKQLLPLLGIRASIQYSPCNRKKILMIVSLALGQPWYTEKHLDSLHTLTHATA